MIKAKYGLTAVIAVLAIGVGVHNGLTQTPPIIIGPGTAPNVGTPTNSNSLGYYGGYYGENNDDYLTEPRKSLYNVSFGPTDIPRTDDSISTKVTGTTVAFQWSGEPRAVQTITFSLLDKNNGVIAKQIITKLPTKATLKKTAKTTGYSVNITYINGLRTNIVSPL